MIDFVNSFVLPNFLPQSANLFMQIYIHDIKILTILNLSVVGASIRYSGGFKPVVSCREMSSLAARRQVWLDATENNKSETVFGGRRSRSRSPGTLSIPESSLTLTAVAS